MRLDSEQAILQLLEQTGYLASRYNDEIELALKSLSGEENIRLGNRLNQLNNACGCTVGAITSVIIFASLIILFKYVLINQSYSSVWLSFYGLVGFLLAAAAGNLAARLYARYRFRHFLYSLLTANKE